MSDEKPATPRMGREVIDRKADGTIVQAITFNERPAGTLSWLHNGKTPFTAKSVEGRQLCRGDYFACKQALFDQVADKI